MPTTLKTFHSGAIELSMYVISHTSDTVTILTLKTLLRCQARCRATTTSATDTSTAISTHSTISTINSSGYTFSRAFSILHPLAKVTVVTAHVKRIGKTTVHLLCSGLCSFDNTVKVFLHEGSAFVSQIKRTSKTLFHTLSSFVYLFLNRL